MDHGQAASPLQHPWTTEEDVKLQNLHSHLCYDLNHISYLQLQLILMLRHVAERSLASALADLLSCETQMYTHTPHITLTVHVT